MKKQVASYTKTDFLEQKLNALSEQNSVEHQAMIRAVEKVEGKIDEVFITKEEVEAKLQIIRAEFEPTRLIAYSFVGIVGTGFLAALLALVFKIKF